MKILNKYNTLSEAVEAADLDLSYNQSLAEQDIRSTDNGYKGSLELLEAYVMEDGTVWYLIQTQPEGLKILHKYSPFGSCLDNSGFQHVYIWRDRFEKLKHIFNRSQLARNYCAKNGYVVTTESI